MPGGSEAFCTERQHNDIARALAVASARTGLDFSAYVGEPDGEPERAAVAAHASLARPRQSVLVLVAPGSHRVEIVTGADAASRLSDQDCALAALSMSSSFAGGDLVGGLLLGLTMLSDRVKARPRGRA